MEGKNQLIVNEVNSKLAVYLGFILFGILFAIAGEYNYGKHYNSFAQGISWAIIIVFFGLFFYLYRRTKAFMLAMRKNISLEEAQSIYAEKRVQAAEKLDAKYHGSRKSPFAFLLKLSDKFSVWEVLILTISLFPMGFFFAYMIIITMIDYIKGNSKPSEFIQNFKNSFKPKTAVVTQD